MAPDFSVIRRQFPILAQAIDGHPLVYLDSAATSQKPAAVLDRMRKFYEEENANAHRGMHVLAERATVAYENARGVIRHFLNARRPEEIVFTKSCTESINLVAKTWGKTHLTEGDAIVLTMLEHHSNIVPWQQLCEERGCELHWVDIEDDGTLKMDQLAAYLKEGHVKLVSLTAQSNVLGVRPLLKKIVTLAHTHGAAVLVDAAQSVAHHQTDVQALDCDFLAFSGHKLYGPTGIGILYGKQEILRSMPPFLGGGMMIQEVHQDRFTPADIPHKFEAGTQPMAEAVGLGAAIDWMAQFSWKDIEAHEQMLLAETLNILGPIKGLRILGPGIAEKISGCVSFVTDGIHPHDLTEILGRQGICLRAGHHCTQPLHRRLGITASSRVSVGIYNTKEDIAALAPALKKAMQHLQR